MALTKVRYKGLSDVRTIGKKDLKNYGVSVDKDLVWERRNGWSLTIDMNDELEEVLKREGTFTISKVDDEGNAGENVITADKQDDTIGATIVDADTGQKSAPKR